MGRQVLTLRLDPKTHRLVAIAAAIQGQSVNEWITNLAEARAELEVEEFIEKQKEAEDEAE